MTKESQPTPPATVEGARASLEDAVGSFATATRRLGGPILSDTVAFEEERFESALSLFEAAVRSDERERWSKEHG